MTLQSNYNSIFTDFLSVTFNPDHFEEQELIIFLCSCGYHLDKSQESVLKFQFELDPLRGFCGLKKTSSWVRFTASGKALDYLRKLGQYENLLFHLSTFPHTVTRIDATIDVPRDFPAVLRAIKRQYKDGSVKLGRQGLKVTTTLSKRDSDGLNSGTLYIGGRRNQVYAKIYDKTLEMFDRFKITLPTTTRYEISFRSTVGITLKDAHDPTSLFWMYGEQLLLKKPKGVSEWVSGGEYIGWRKDMNEVLPYDKLRRSIEESQALNSWKVVADSMGANGRQVLLNLLVKDIVPGRNELTEVNLLEHMQKGVQQ